MRTLFNDRMDILIDHEAKELLASTAQKRGLTLSEAARRAFSLWVAVDTVLERDGHQKSLWGSEKPPPGGGG